jgi:hypothetical protein
MSSPSADAERILSLVTEPAKVTLSSEEASALVLTFAGSRRRLLQTRAYVALSAYCQRHADRTGGTSESAYDDLARGFLPSVTSNLADPDRDIASSALGFLVALFQIEHHSATRIFTNESVVESLSDILDTCTSGEVLTDVAHLVSQASAHKACREVMPSEVKSWLDQQTRQTGNAALRAAAGTALVKLSQGAAVDSTEVASASRSTDTAALLKNTILIITSETDVTAVTDAVEGLAYLSRDTNVAEQLSKDPAFLKKLFARIPRKRSATEPSYATQAVLTFGILTVILNMVAYRPRLSGEHAQIEKIRRMANAGAGSTGKLEEQALPPSGDDAHVKERCARLVQAGAAEAVVSGVRVTESKAAKLAAGKALLHIVEDRASRGRVLQAGGAKALLLIIRDATEDADKQQTPADVLNAIQALAKLAITASPMQVFGADLGTMLDGVRPLSLLLTHDASTSLQCFEAMMALTNLSSHGPEASNRIAAADGALVKIELLMLDDHVLTRRAAVELLCNLVSGSEQTFERYAGAGASKSRLQILVALADVDDLGTQLASSGALATITMSPRACQLMGDLQLEHHRVWPVLVSLLGGADETNSVDTRQPGLAHRGAVCITNFLEGIQDVKLRKQLAIEGEQEGVVRALVRMAKDATKTPELQPALGPAAAALKLFLSSGVSVQV